ncbi:MAG TPA: alpha/beta fold hydrolase, partial [Albitalea sp.]|nr:alpha/beta fold hydrolase [Albitalea sp.]
MRPPIRLPARPDPHWLAAAVGTAAVLAACAVVVQRQTAKAERDFPPKGRFVVVEGVRLHFTVHGRDDAAQTLVLLHGDGSFGEEFDISGLVRQAAERYRVVIFDRPGHGHSERPADRRFGPEAQADLIRAALLRLGVADPIVLGHDSGALVALAMGLRHPQDLGSLVLVAGRYYPGVRPALRAGSSLPGVGALLRHTIAPLLGRLLWPAAVKRRFAPQAPPNDFTRRFPVWLSLRPSQLKAVAA